MSKKKLMIVDPLSSHGGMHYYVNDQACALASFGLDVLVASPFRFPDPDPEYTHVEFFRDIYSSKPKYWRAVKLVEDYVMCMKHARKLGFSTIIFHIFKSDIFEYIGTCIARLYGMNIISIVHDVERLDARSRISFSSTILKRSKNVVTHNLFSKHQIVKSNPEIEDRIIVIPHGNYKSHFPNAVSKEQSRSSLGIAASENVILFFGNPRREKGLHILLEAIVHLRHRGDFLVLFAGKMKDDQFREYQAFIRDNQLEHLIRMDVGHVSDDMVQYYYTASDLIALPYLRVYESGVALMAATLARPMIASDLPVFHEMADQGAGVVLFPPGDAAGLAAAINAVLFDPGRREEMAAKNHRFAMDNRNWAKMIAPLADAVVAYPER